MVKFFKYYYPSSFRTCSPVVVPLDVQRETSGNKMQMKHSFFYTIKRTLFRLTEIILHKFLQCSHCILSIFTYSLDMNN